MAEPKEPDYRFTLANERTFLAWMRTSLALLAGAVAVVQFAPDLGSEGFRGGLAVVLAVLAAGTAFGGLLRWTATQRAMEQGRRLGRGLLPVVIALGLTVVALAALVAVVVELGR